MDENMRALMTRLEELLRNVHQYVGARYVPNFIEEPWSDIREYEALDVVDNGTGTSYIARKPVHKHTHLECKPGKDINKRHTIEHVLGHFRSRIIWIIVHRHIFRHCLALGNKQGNNHQSNQNNCHNNYAYFILTI